MNTIQSPEDRTAESAPPESPREPLRENAYASRYQRDPEPDLDATAPELRATELQRMNRRALLLLVAVVVLLLFVAYWMITGVGRKRDAPRQREEKVTVAQAPAALSIPQLPPATQPQPRSARPIPLMPPPTAPPLPTPPLPSRSMQAVAGPTLLQRRIAASSAEGGAGSLPANSAGTSLLATTGPTGEASGATSAQPLTHPDTLMQRGTYIRCVLETRIVSDVAGYSTCLVTEPVYSFNGRALLLPKGSKLLGTYNSKPAGDRMAVIWDRIITPSGIDVNMKSPGMDNLGGAGLPGRYDAHWTRRISAALLISLLSDAFKYEAAEHGPRTTTVGNGFVTQTPFESNTARTVQNLADQAVREAANRPPTVTINQGTIIYVYVARDVDFSGVVARF